MCGRFTIRIPATVLMHQFGVDAGLQMPMRYNVAPTQQIPVITQHDGKRQLETMRWGLVPSWADDPKIGYRMINARSEEAATKASFRSAMKKRRCLILADGFYEWEKIGKAKQPHWFRMANEQPFAFAGLWERWGKVDPPLDSCTILTTSANELVGKYHNRMPVILSPNDYGAWLDPANQDSDSLRYLFEPFPASELIDTKVNPIVNNARSDTPDCIEPIID